MNKAPLTELERLGLKIHRLPITTPSELSDCFRNGVAWALSKSQTTSQDAWVSSAERMPELADVQIHPDFKISKKVLVFNTFEGIKSGYSVNDIWSIANTHWMPLPNSPVMIVAAPQLSKPQPISKDEIIKLAKKAGANRIFDTEKENYMLMGNGAIIAFTELILASQAQPTTSQDIRLRFTEAQILESQKQRETIQSDDDIKIFEQWWAAMNDVDCYGEECHKAIALNAWQSRAKLDKPQSTSQDTERLKYLHTYYSDTGQLVDTTYEQWIANIDAMKESK